MKRSRPGMLWTIGLVLGLCALSQAQSSGPTLSFISPSSGGQGASLSVSLSGSNFLSPATISVFTVASAAPVNPGVAVSSVTVVNSTLITAIFTIAPNAILGTASVTVSTSAGTSPGVSFTITPPAPTLSSITPNGGAPGSTVSVTLTGTNFVSGSYVIVSNEFVSATSVNVVSSTQMTAVLTISPSAPLGPATVTVSSPNGASGSLPFTIHPPAPVLSAISPSSGVPGTTVPVTLTGNNFQSGAVVSVSNLSIAVTGVTVVSATQITAALSISSGAPFVPVDVTVSTAGGTSAAAIFTILPPPPTLTSITPNTGVQGSTVSVTVTGTNLVSGISLLVNNYLVFVTSVNVVSATQITAVFTISPAAPLGPVSVTASDTGGNSGSVSFTVLPPTPVLSSISPSNGMPGATIPVTLTGNNFQSSTTVNVSNANVAVSAVTVVSANLITATFTIGSAAPLGPLNVTVSTGSEASAAVVFTVVPPVPTLTSITPGSGPQNSVVAVTLTGTNFVSGATVNVADAGVTVNSVRIASATQITAAFSIAATSALGPVAVSVSTPGGTSGTSNFVITPPTPAVTSISPSSGPAGATVPVTLTGTNFGSGATVSIANTGVTVSNVIVVSPTQITASFVISPSASAGAAAVTVSTSSGTSEPVTFNIGPALTLTSVSPATGAQASNVTVTLTGTGFAAGGTVNVSSAGVVVNNVTVVSPTQITATFAIALNATAGAASVTVSVFGVTSGAATFTITPAVLPSVSISGGEGSAINPLGTKTFSINLPGVAPAPTSGTLALQFTSDAVNPVSSDPEVGFVSGTTQLTNVSFSFPAGQTQAVLSPADAVVQTGTVSGTVSVLISSYQGGTPPNPIIGSVTVSRTAPQITSIKLANKTASGFDVCVAGYSPTRDITSVTYQFTGSGQGSLQTTQLTAGSDLTGKFTTWFQGGNSIPFGGQFLLDQTFTVNGADTAIGSISVALQNVTGTNTSASVPYSGFASSCN